MVNSLDIDTGDGHGDLMGFYPVFSNINHSCISNCKPVKTKDMRVEVRAKRDIEAGEEISIQYLIETQPTRVRRQLIYRKWFFMCSCDRCQDNTECGTYLDALLCPVKNVSLNNFYKDISFLIIVLHSSVLVLLSQFHLWRVTLIINVKNAKIFLITILS